MNATSDNENKRGTFSSKLRVRALAVLFAVLPGWALAYDCPPTGCLEGRVNVIQYGTGSGFGFTLVGEPRLCTNDSPFAVWAGVSERWGHMPESIKQMLSAVTAAYLSGRSVRVFPDNNPDGSCKATVIELLPY